MQRFFFHFYDGQRAFRDDDGLDLADEGAARTSARKAAQTLISDLREEITGASAWRQRTCWSMRFLHGPCAIEEPSPAMRALPAHPTRAAAGGARKGSPRQATPACGAG